MKINQISFPSEIEKALLELGYVDFTAIQEKTLPSLLEGKDVLGEAPTGTGKTAAYALPMIVGTDAQSNRVQSLVICPTRELAVQVIQELKKFAKYLPAIRYAAIYGGQKVTTQLRELKTNPQIIVGTPGRLNDLIERRSLSLKDVHYLVLDECDEMLEMGFIKDVNKIIDQVTAPHQTCLFSATISNEIKNVAERYLKKDAIRVQIKRTLSQENQIAQKYVMVSEKDKTEAVVSLLTELTFTRAFVFCRTKHKVKQLEKILQKNTSHAITSLQGNLSQSKRDKAMKDFRNYDADVMVATDIAARGIDVNDVDLVINYDIPEEDEFYLHRIGRTGRVDKSGVSYTFITPSERSLIKKYEAMTHCPLNEYVINKGNVMKKYLENLEPKLQSDLKEEKDAISEVCATLSAKEGHEVTPLDLAAILLKEKMEAPASPIASERDYSSSHNRSIDRNKERKQFKTEPGNQRFFINVGFEDGANADNLKAFIAKNAKGVDVSDFADIYLKGTFSFFELPESKSDAIIQGIEGKSCFDKDVHVEKTERPSDSPYKVRHSDRGEEHHSYAGGEHRSYSGGEHHSYAGGEHHSSSGEKRPSYHNDGEHRPFRGGKKHY